MSLTDVPSPTHLASYADLLGDCALGAGTGIGRGDVVLVDAPADGRFIDQRQRRQEVSPSQ